MEVKPGIEAVHFSIGEPSAPKSLDALLSQVGAEFDKIRSFEDVRPLSKAETRAMNEAEYKLLMMVAGDIVLKPQALEYMLSLVHKVRPKRRSKVYAYRFTLKDAFLDKPICCIRIFNTKNVRKVGFSDVLRDDVDATNRAKADGLDDVKFTKPRGFRIVGSHFTEPAEWQIFSRFYALGAKYAHKEADRLLMKETANAVRAFKRFRDLPHACALAALDIGKKTAFYPTSHDFELDKELYEKYGGEMREDGKILLRKLKNGEL